MNSILVDDNTELPGNADTIRKQLNEAIAPPEDKETSPKAEDALPDKYRGKSREEIAEMHRNAESELGRRANELGQYRQLTDRLLELKRHEDLAKGGVTPEETEQDDTPLPAITGTELLENPTSAISKLLTERDKSTERKRQREEAVKAKEEAERIFAETYPDAGQIVSDPKFAEWVKTSKARTVLGMNAANGDLVAGSALLEEWKMTQDSTETAEESAKPTKDPLEDARRATTESTGQSNTPDKPTGKVYRRLDLIRLKLEDPEAYGDDNFQREIMRAYAEGRVK